MSVQSETRQLKAAVAQLLEQHLSVHLRERDFDPRVGRHPSSRAVDLAFVRLPRSRSQNDGPGNPEERAACRGSSKVTGGHVSLEKEAEILSAYASCLIDSLNLEEVFMLYRHRPSDSLTRRAAKREMTQLSSLSTRPPAMLMAPYALRYAKQRDEPKKTKTGGRGNKGPHLSPVKSTPCSESDGPRSELASGSLGVKRGRGTEARSQGTLPRVRMT
ncbi:uncharacterized protein C2orf80 homolog isoform X1 [Petromyzon marinus]|uniref:Uncharacterized protein LOC116941043 isoform X1 n=1 Tax=Petromyzon marinus TaxID=7757 RepID=A0AAJ7WRQ4_PETMA|nr:uncharacterized protein LOC116941043 isoform X1 [Petromyzon marinus]XP_032807515.1 uncharacterized protein LOC116941043 isoform X1 [Petromyzon marinus]XP_032807517.1 uncharacterized protein LOC116941043 isoform X1 [Petromyzon marinus]